MKKLRTVVSTTLINVVTLSMVALGSAPAQAADSPAGEQYCVVVLAKAASPDADSSELYSYCSATPFDTAAHLEARAAENPRLATAAQTHLARMFDRPDFDDDGDKYDVYGSDGPCDQYGYTWNPSDKWKSRTTSIEQGYYSDCNRARVSSKNGKKWKVFTLPEHYIGEYDNNVSKVLLYHG